MFDLNLFPVQKKRLVVCFKAVAQKKRLVVLSNVRKAAWPLRIKDMSGKYFCLEKESGLILPAPKSMKKRKHVPNLFF